MKRKELNNDTFNRRWCMHVSKLLNQGYEKGDAAEILLFSAPKKPLSCSCN